MNRPFIVWTHDGKAPEILARAATLPEAKVLWSNSKHAAISSGGVLADVRNTTGNTQARAMERAAEDAWRTQGEAPASVAAPAVPAKPSRPAATRPPLPRRRTAPVAVTPTPAAPAVEEEPVAAAAPEPAPAADAAEAKVARLQRLLDQVSRERDAHRDRAEVDAHHLEQLRGEVEGLTTDLGVARHDLARVTAQSNEARAEKLEALGAEAFAWDLVDLAMTAGLAAVSESRAETDAMCRQAADLSRQLGALRDATLPAPVAAVPAPVLLDELMLERIAQRAARRAVALQGDAAKLDRLCREHGGADAVARIVEGALALRKAVG